MVPKNPCITSRGSPGPNTLSPTDSYDLLHVLIHRAPGDPPIFVTTKRPHAKSERPEGNKLGLDMTPPFTLGNHALLRIVYQCGYTVKKDIVPKKNALS